MLVPYGKAQEAASGIDTLGGESNARVDHTRYNPSIPIGGVIPSQYWWMSVKAYERLSIVFDLIGGKDGVEGVKTKLGSYTALRFKERDEKEEQKFQQLQYELKGIDKARIENYFVLKDVVEGEIRWVANSTPRMAETMQIVIKGSYEGQTTLTIQPKQKAGPEEGTQSMADESKEEVPPELVQYAG